MQVKYYNHTRTRTSLCLTFTLCLIVIVSQLIVTPCEGAKIKSKLKPKPKFKSTSTSTQVKEDQQLKHRQGTWVSKDEDNRRGFAGTDTGLKSNHYNNPYNSNNNIQSAGFNQNSQYNPNSHNGNVFPSQSQFQPHPAPVYQPNPQHRRPEKSTPVAHYGRMRPTNNLKNAQMLHQKQQLAFYGQFGDAGQGGGGNSLPMKATYSNQNPPSLGQNVYSNNNNHNSFTPPNKEKQQQQQNNWHNPPPGKQNVHSSQFSNSKPNIRENSNGKPMQSSASNLYPSNPSVPADLGFIDENDQDVQESEKKHDEFDDDDPHPSYGVIYKVPGVKMEDNPTNFLNLVGTDFQPGRLVNIWLVLCFMMYMIVSQGYSMWVAGLSFKGTEAAIGALPGVSQLQNLIQSLTNALPGMPTSLADLPGLLGLPEYKVRTEKDDKTRKKSKGTIAKSKPISRPLASKINSTKTLATSKTNSTLTPSTSKTNSTLTPETSKTNSTLTPETSKTNSTLTPETSKTNSTLTPEESKINSTLTPETSKTNATSISTSRALASEVGINRDARSRVNSGPLGPIKELFDTAADVFLDVAHLWLFQDRNSTRFRAS